MSEPCFLCRGACNSKCEHCIGVYYCSEDHYFVHRPAHRCVPFLIRYRPEVGNYVVASQRIAAGEVVISDHPVASGPGSKTSVTCLNCLKDWKGEFDCAVCGWPVCGEECQKGANHQIECSLLSACPIEKRPDFREELTSGQATYHASILPLRLLLLQATNPGLSKRLDLLMDNIVVISKEDCFQARWEHPVLDFLVNILKSGFTRDQVLRAIGILCTNAISMGHCCGSSVYPTFSFLSHSCISNCRFFLHPGNKVVVTAQTEILEGEEVTIPYVNPTLGSVIRRPTLNTHWRFQCQCVRCQDPSELGTNSSTIRCRRCDKESNSSGIILSSDVNNLEADWTCSFCGYIVNNSTMMTLVRTLEANISDNKHDTDDLEKLLESLQKLLHPNHYLLMKLKQKWLKLITEKEETFTKPETLVKILNYIEHITEVNAKIEPGFTLTLGENLKILNKSMMTLAKLKVNSGEMSKLELITMARKAANNVKIAEKCFEDSN